MEFAAAGLPLRAIDIAEAGDILQCSPESLWTLVQVETAGTGFLPDRRPAMLFERHYFSRITGGRYDALDPDISAQVPGGYGPPGEHQYDRLQAAIQLDRSAALESASWGIGQVMGSGYRQMGYREVEAMVSDVVASEGAQLICMARYIHSIGLSAALRVQNWTQVARGYNGPAYAAHHYAARLAATYQGFCDHGLPDLDVRAAQLGLIYRGWHLWADGRMGPTTRAALVEFQTRQGLTPSGTPDPGTLERLISAQPAGAVSAAR